MTMKQVALEIGGLCFHAESTRANSCKFTMRLPCAALSKSFAHFPRTGSLSPPVYSLPARGNLLPDSTKRKFRQAVY